MESPRDEALMAILSSDFTEEELKSIADHSFGIVSEEQSKQIYFKMKLREAMELIATMPVTDGQVNDADYNAVMEQIENWRNDWLHDHLDRESDEECGLQPKASTVVQKQKRKISPLGKEHLRSNAAKARAARAKAAKSKR